MQKYAFLSAALVAAAVLSSRGAHAGACSTISRANLVTCALQASLERRAGQAAVDAAQGRVTTSEVLLPSHPALGVTAARRSGTEGRVTNWSASLGVELEVAGQRGQRRREALAEREARKSEVQVVEREAAAEAWRAYFEVLASRDAGAVLLRLEGTSQRVWQAAQAAAERGRASGVEADIAEHAYLNVKRRRLTLEREGMSAALSLALLVGLSAGENPAIAGSLEPLREATRIDAGAHVPEPPQVAALEAERRAFAARASAWRRSRVPNPTVSVFVERDGFNENVVGVGLGLPLPLPGPLAPSRAGEIVESEALSSRAAILAERERRTARVDFQRALGAYRGAVEVARTFTPERLARAEQALANLAGEVEAGRLAVREAVLFQAPLLEQLLSAVEAQRTVCLESVELVRAAGRSLDGGRQ